MTEEQKQQDKDTKDAETSVENSDAVELDDELKSVKVSKRGKGIYLLPNLFTTASLFSGFYAIVAAMKDAVTTAGRAIATLLSPQPMSPLPLILKNAESSLAGSML